MGKYTLEVCVDSVESVLAAKRGGADRVELCSNLIIGGTTPTAALFRTVRKACDIRVHVLIRPRFGDFCYTDYEFEMIREEVRMFRELGANGVVIGILKPDGTLNMEQMRILMEEAGTMSATLHRAFDVCRDPFEALEQAKELGIQTILTSGQCNTCLEGKKLLAELDAAAGNEITIMAGSGVDAEVIRELGAQTKLTSFHMSGKTTLDSEMEYRRDGVNMGLPFASEYTLWRTEEAKVRAAREVLGELEGK